MLQCAKIDGFRSLVEFEIDMEPGLQVLVGANGAGKSNFVEFLDFVGELLATDLDSAIAVGEGAGSIFSRERHTRDNAHLKFSISGISTTINRNSQTNSAPVKYKYEAHIRYDKRIPSIYINKETIYINHNELDEFRIERKTDFSSGNFKTTIKASSKKHSLYLQTYQSLVQFSRNEERPLEEIISRSVSPSTSLLRRLTYGETAFDAVWSDITAFRSINVDPAAARLPSPVSRESGIKRTGENLALVLYKMAKGEYYGHDYWWISQEGWTNKQRTSYKSIINWCRELNSEITSVRSELDLAEAVLKPQIEFSFSNLPFAFSRISDGTVKWVALVATLFAEQRFSVIEEPENFLHPRMQEGIITLAREVLQRKPKDSQFIMSTHSQTILDVCQPYEVIIFFLEDGKTRAKKPRDIGHLQSILRESDFGIGHMYKIGALSV
jgi:predicted ATPase